MYVIGYPKSGNTWFSYLLSYCLNATYDDLDDPGVHPTDPYQRRYVKGGLAHTSYEPALGKVWKTHRIGAIGESHTQPKVYIVRDARDVMVSYFFYTRNQQNHGKDLASFVREHITDWKRHVSAWLEQDAGPVVRYEDLLQTPVGALQTLFSKLGVSVSEDVVKKSHDVFSFQQLANRKPGDEDRSSFFRKGVSGDWRNHFDAESKAIAIDRVGELLVTLNYENDLHW